MVSPQEFRNIFGVNIFYSLGGIHCMNKLFTYGKTPWKWKLSFQETFFGDFLSEIPVLSRESMLNYKLMLFY